MSMSKPVLAAAVSALVLAAGGAAYASPGMMGGGDVTRAEAQEKSDAMFARMDANGDGVLNDADREARLAKRFEGLDTDGNGSISREEFVAGHDDKGGHHMADGDEDKPGPKGRGDKHHGGMRGAMMDKADTNGDGAVSSAEFKAAHMAMFDKADTNKDGTITKDERRAAMKDMRAGWKKGQPEDE